MKSVLQPEHVARNRYEMIVLGMPSFTFTKLTGIEQALDVVDLPDRTKASGGRAQAGTMGAAIPAHHTLEYAAMLAWIEDAKAPVGENYKKTATIILKPIGNSVAKTRTITVLGVWPSKKAISDQEMDNDGEMTELEVDLNFDDMLPV
jgi:hypothetical protein